MLCSLNGTITNLIPRVNDAVLLKRELIKYKWSYLTVGFIWKTLIGNTHKGIRTSNSQFLNLGKSPRTELWKVSMNNKCKSSCHWGNILSKLVKVYHTERKNDSTNKQNKQRYPVLKQRNNIFKIH